MVSTYRAWSDAQLRAATRYIETFVLPDAVLSPCDTPGAKAGEYSGVPFLRWDHDGSIELVEDGIEDEGMSALLASYNDWAADGFVT